MKPNLSQNRLASANEGARRRSSVATICSEEVAFITVVKSCKARRSTRSRAAKSLCPASPPSPILLAPDQCRCTPSAGTSRLRDRHHESFRRFSLRPYLQFQIGESTSRMCSNRRDGRTPRPPYRRGESRDSTELPPRKQTWLEDR